jgi:alkylglycerol monooxygenase
VLNPIGMAVPAFFGLIGLEWWLLARKGRAPRLNDTLANLSCGLGEQLIGLFTKALSFGIYASVLAWGPADVLDPSSPAVWLLGMVGVDLFYYAYHRFSHRVGFAWATHGVHHQSEEYNLSVALRQPWFTQAYSWAFYLPLALVGLPLEVYAVSYALNLLYQFWIHTETIGRLGPLEWAFNTPSHHRVHHGVNPAYVDKNYGGILITWDRIFGTFALEEEPVSYGVLDPLRSWNPVVANTRIWAKLATKAAALPSWGHKLGAVLHAPAWTPEGEWPPAPVADQRGRGHNARPSPVLLRYLLLNLAPVGLMTGWMINFEVDMSTDHLIIGSVLTLWTALGWSGLTEGRPWAVPLEWTRLLTLSLLGMMWLPHMVGAAALAWGVVAILLFHRALRS